MIHVDPLGVAEVDDELAACRIETEDATGRTRTYRVNITAGFTVNGAHVQAGKRTDDDAPDDPAGGGVPSRVFDEARSYFESEGFEVFGGRSS